MHNLISWIINLGKKNINTSLLLLLVDLVGIVGEKVMIFDTWLELFSGWVEIELFENSPLLIDAADNSCGAIEFWEGASDSDFLCSSFLIAFMVLFVTMRLAIVGDSMWPKFNFFGFEISSLSECLAELVLLVVQLSLLVTLVSLFIDEHEGDDNWDSFELDVFKRIEDEDVVVDDEFEDVVVAPLWEELFAVATEAAAAGGVNW